MSQMYWEKMREDLLSKSDLNGVVDDGRLSLLKIDNGLQCSNNVEDNENSSSVKYKKNVNTSQRNQNYKVKQKLLDVKNTLNKHPTSQELEIMNIFTSKEWSEIPFSSRTLNIIENKDVLLVNQRLEKNVSDKTVNEIKSKGNNNLPDIIVNRENSFINKNEIESKLKNNASTTKIYEEEGLITQYKIKSNSDKESEKPENSSIIKMKVESKINTESTGMEMDQISDSNGKNNNITTPKQSYDNLTLDLREEQDYENDLESLDENNEKFARSSAKLSDNKSENVSIGSFKSIIDVTKKPESQITCSIINKDVIFEDLVSHNEEMLDRLKNDVIISNKDIILSANQNIIEDESCFYGEESTRKQETSLKRDSLSVSELSTEKTISENFNFDDFTKHYDFETICSSSSMQSLDTTIMTRVMRQNKPNTYVTEQQISDEPAALDGAMKLIFDKTKDTLGNILVEGLYEVAKGHRNDPFGYLGRWLLAQADIRDEYYLEHESDKEDGF